MTVPRRFLPSISSLLALEAVERLGTATAAAVELALTHSAVSRQLKVLEEQIGVTMFRRAGKGLALTPAGVDYARTIRAALQDVARASLKIGAGGSRTNLNLAILPSFGAHWLGPRLRTFSQAYGDLNINLSTRLVPFDFGLDPFDGAIHYGRRDWQGVEYLELTREKVIPAAAPSLLARPVTSAEHLLTMPLLHLESRPGAWEAWFEQNGCKPEGLRGMLFDQFTTLAEAAVLGFGLALLPEFLAEREFQSGRLVPAATDYADVDGAYFLVWPANNAVGPAMSALIDWLRRNA